MTCKKCGSPIYYNRDYNTFMCYTCYAPRLPFEPFDLIKDINGNIGEIVAVHIQDKDKCFITVNYKELKKKEEYSILSENKEFYLINS